MNLDKHVPKPWRRSRWFWPVIAAVSLICLILIVVPPAVILTRKEASRLPATTVIIPLYMYPLNGSSWDPVYDAIVQTAKFLLVTGPLINNGCSATRRPDLNLTVIVNPDSGPGDEQYPDPQYDMAVRRLNSYPNIETVGYVRTGYGTRNLSDVTREVSIYAGWSRKSSALAMNGIFFDEAPYQYSPQAVKFLQAADLFAKNVSGLQGRKLIIHNPGVIPDNRYNSSDVDVTVVFEEAYATWQSKIASLEALPKTRGAYSILVHSLPAMSNSTLSEFVDQVSVLADYVFVTALSVDYYNSFAPDWLNFIGQVPGR